MGEIRIDHIEHFVDAMGSPVRSPVLSVGQGSPHVVLVALQHGDEVLGADAALGVLAQIIPAGTLSVLAVANPLAFAEGRRRGADSYDPLSLQPANLNSRHPGDGRRVVDLMARAAGDWIAKCEPDIVIDVHAAGVDSVPHVILDALPAGPMVARLQELATRAQLPSYTEAVDPSTPALDHSLSATWCRMGVASLTIEVGPRGAITPANHRRARAALLNVLAVAGTYSAPVHAVSEQLFDFLTPGGVGRCVELTFSGSDGGYLRPLQAAGDVVDEGALLAEVVSPGSNRVEAIFSPCRGSVLVWNSEWRILPGSALGQFITRSE